MWPLVHCGQSTAQKSGVTRSRDSPSHTGVNGTPYPLLFGSYKSIPGCVSLGTRGVAVSLSVESVLVLGDYPNAGIAETVVCDCNRLLLNIRL